MLGEGERLDVALVSRGLLESRTLARRCVEAGDVTVNGSVCQRVSYRVSAEDEIVVGESRYCRYVGQGGLKLEHGLRFFDLDVSGARVLDAGASTGGFTDCLLQSGARCVYAVDVGRDQLHPSLCEDERVVNLSPMDIRLVGVDDLDGSRVDGVTCDLSFIGLSHVFAHFGDLVFRGGWGVILLKPQFEVGRVGVRRGGLVRDEGLIEQALEEFRTLAMGCGWEVIGHTESPLGGPGRNREFLYHVVRSGGGG